jgi:hypothetical protein
VDRDERGAHLADRHDLVAERLERLHHLLEREILAGLVGMPEFRPHAAREIHRAEPERRVCRCLALGRQGRNHGVEERERHGGAHGAAQERAAGQVLLRNDHRFSTFVLVSLRDFVSFD